MTSRAYAIFETGMQDVAKLIQLFDNLESQEQRQQYEVLKRAALVMTAAAWETYIEAFAIEQVEAKLALSEDEFTAAYIRRRLDHEINRLHNPTSDKVKKLFIEFLGVDITESWRWNNYTPKEARERLDKWLKMRGDAVHQICQSGDPKNAHLVKREDLDKAVRFFRELANSTDGIIK
ncbi:hypothetical protein WG68_11960 [Arsukibacterium ikkense]|uniref:RiboL-PSP-HEPN domain-containing protein n=1 Tax=Arsukibacterium ikkense TaxID=336831 RepID=A0A0M2V2S5_9GAMM|nr:HEPN domain-containing protein [Arsukibacterium ikkense]KKO45137.1 hypothetical protein WG68_11960 [Arsukibacterium ikkense]